MIKYKKQKKFYKKIKKKGVYNALYYNRHYIIKNEKSRFYNFTVVKLINMKQMQ